MRTISAFSDGRAAVAKSPLVTRDLIYKSYKSAESEVPRRLVFFGIIAQQTDIEPAALAVRHRAGDSVEARLLAHSADELARAQVSDSLRRDSIFLRNAAVFSSPSSADAATLR